MKTSTFLTALGVVVGVTSIALFTQGNVLSDTVLLLLGYRGEEPILPTSTVLFGLGAIDAVAVPVIGWYWWKSRRQHQLRMSIRERTRREWVRRLSEEKM